MREFATLAFHHAGIELRWEGQGIDEKGIVEAVSLQQSAVRPGDVVVAVSPDFYRPTDVVNLLGDPSKAKRELGWNPQKTSFEQLVEIMVKHDMQKVTREHFNLAEYLEKGIVK